MKVAQVSTQVLRSYEYPNGGWVLVRVRTESGVEGIGECFVPDPQGRGVFAAREVIEGSLARVVLGEDVRHTERIWERMYEVCGRMYDRRGLAIHGLSGVDMAVHDAAARAMGVPLCVLLGGCLRERVRVYVSSIWVDPAQPEPALEATARYVGEGFTALKYYGWPGFGVDPRRDSALLQQVRQRAGEGVDLMLDLGRPGCLEEAVHLARMIEESGTEIYWWEEPFSSSDDAAALARLRTKTHLAIAAGEQEMTAFAFRDLILKEAVGVLQPDLSWVGGLTEGRRIASLARLFRVPLVPHNWGTMVNFAASVHLVAAMPRGFLCEYPITPRLPGAGQPTPMMTELARTPVAVEGGYAQVPQGPGLGIELDEAAVARYTCE